MQRNGHRSVARASVLEIEGDDHIISRWTGYNQGEAASSMSFDLARR